MSRNLVFARRSRPWSTRIVNPLADFVCKAWAPGAFPLTRFPIEWNHWIETASLKIKELKQDLGEKVWHFFKECPERGSKQRPGVAVARAAGHSGLELKT